MAASSLPNGALPACEHACEWPMLPPADQYDGHISSGKVWASLAQLLPFAMA